MNAGLILIPGLPAIAAALIAVLGKRIGLRGAAAISILFSGASLVITCLIAFQGVIAGNVLTAGHVESYSAGQFIQFGDDWKAALALRMDLLSGMMSLLVTLFGTLILIFSYDYMRDDKEPVRYFAGLSLFISLMLILVLSENLILLFLGWEGVGLCSYLLIGHYWRDEGVPLAAYRAFFVNRIGDLFFILGVFLLLRVLGTVSFPEMAEKFKTMSASGLSAETRTQLVIATFLLLGGAFGKSAQVPLHVWLPDAMAGPTPVSALIHAATMVTAGVFLVARLDWLYSAIPDARAALLVCGLLTLILGAVLACFQNDIKKVLAYSTLSHLGLMFTALAAGASSSALFHLFGHASFKALSFLAAGSIILSAHHEQDLRKLRGALHHLPIARIALWVGAIGGAGVLPILSSGFFSKESILHSISHGTFSLLGVGIPGMVVYWIVFAAEILGVVYLFRMMALLESGEPAHEVHESGAWIKFVLLFLAVLAPVFGVLSSPYVHGFQSLLFEHAEHVDFLEMAFASGTSLIVAVLVFVSFRKDAVESRIESAALAGPIARLFYFDVVYDAILLGPLGHLAALSQKFLEKPLFQGLLRGGASVSQSAARKLSRLQHGLINEYAIIILVSGAVVLMMALLT